MDCVITVFPAFWNKARMSGSVQGTTGLCRFDGKLLLVFPNKRNKRYEVKHKGKYLIVIYFPNTKQIVSALVGSRQTSTKITWLAKETHVSRVFLGW